MFVHRDYLLHSNVKVEVFDDRMEIISPGGIPDGLTLAEIKDGLTAARNPRLIHILDKMKYIENYGTGIQRIYRAYESFHKDPQFIVRENSFKVVLPNQNYVRITEQESIMRGEQNNRITELNKSKVLEVLKLSDRPLKRLEIQAKTGLTRDQVVAALKSLRREGSISVLGASVNTRYLAE